MKNTLFILLLAFLLIPAYAKAIGTEPDSLKQKACTSIAEEEPGIDLENHFMFRERVYLHILDLEDRILVDGSFSRADLQKDERLRSLLKSSTLYLTLDDHYYYFVDSAALLKVAVHKAE